MSSNTRYYAIEFTSPIYDNNTDKKKVVGATVIGTGYQRIEDEVVMMINGNTQMMDSVCTGLYKEDGTLLPTDYVCEYRLKNGMNLVIPPFVKAS